MTAVYDRTAAGHTVDNTVSRAITSTYRQARCHECGSPTITAICCACRRLLCSDHDHSSEMRRSAVSVGTPQPPTTADTSQDVHEDDAVGTSAADGAGVIESVPAPERERRDAPKKPSERHFCRDCRPLGRPRDPEVMAAAAEIALGATAGIWNIWIGGLLATVGAVRVGLRVVAGRRRAGIRTRRHGRPGLYLDPRITKLEMSETITGSLSLVDGECTTEITSASGSVEMEAVWSRAHTSRVADHRRKHDLGPADELHFSAGSLLVRGPGRMALTPAATDREHPMVVELRPAVADHQVLANPEGRGDPRWKQTFPYSLAAPEVGERMPVWVTLAISPGSGGRTLDIAVQWRLREADDPWADTRTMPASEKIDKFRLTVPAAWGDVRAASEAELFTTTNPTGDGVRVIEWRRPAMPADNSDRGLCQLSVAFERRIIGHGAEPNPEVDGRLEMVFAGTLSEAERVQVHAAGGARRQDGAHCKVRTRVELDLHMELSGLRFQDVRTVPNATRDVVDPARDIPDPAISRQTFPGVLPDHLTVARLTDSLCQQGYYVMRVIENPAKGGHGADVRKGFWDIGGRRYQGVHPVDFTILLAGEDSGSDHSAPAATIVGLIVRGAYSDDLMERHIVAEHERLWERIKACLLPDEIPRTGPGAGSARLRWAVLVLRHRLAGASRQPDADVDLIAGLIRFVDDELLEGESPHDIEPDGEDEP